MAYRQNHDPYNGNPSISYLHDRAGPGVTIVGYPQQMSSTQSDADAQSNYDAHSNYDAANWDAKSYQSSHYSSQAHINLDPYEMSQVNVHHNIPPVPKIPFQPNYPPHGPIRNMTSGYSLARDKLMNRRSVRQVELFRGNLVLDIPVPSGIVPKAMSTSEEMTKMRYTAATCDPDDFMKSQYSLRPYLYGRHTELFIVMTMYNEDEILFVKTMNAYVYPVHVGPF
jgi:chitin synthase